jgi:hypothetical protein
MLIAVTASVHSGPAGPRYLINMWEPWAHPFMVTRAITKGKGQRSRFTTTMTTTPVIVKLGRPAPLFIAQPTLRCGSQGTEASGSAQSCLKGRVRARSRELQMLRLGGAGVAAP